MGLSFDGQYRRAFALSTACAVSVLVVACNAISGADGLEADPTSDEAPITNGKHSTTSSSSSSSSSGSTSSTTSSGGGSSSGIPDDLHGRDAAVDAPTSSSTDASFDSATTTAPSLDDNFDRADGPNIGNGWLVKTANKYSLATGAVQQAGNTGTYVDNIVYRNETSRDVQVEVDVVYGQNFDTDAALYARMQQTSMTQNQLQGYQLYVYRDYAAIERADVTVSGDLTGVQLSPNLEIGKSYHMTFRVTGTSPVVLQATISEADGTPITALNVNDDTPNKITAEGKVGFGAGKAGGTRWDNYVRVDF